MKLVDRLYLAQRGRCFHCGLSMLITPVRKLGSGYDNGYSREHLIPVSRGGKNVGNVVLAHHRCNTARGNKLPNRQQLAKRDQIIHRAARPEQGA